MSMKQNVEQIKGELNSEEKFIESFVKVERFYKRYKMVLIGALFTIVIIVAGYSINSYITSSNKLAANEAYAILMEDLNDSEALKTLQDKNPKLAQIIEAKKAKQDGKSANIDIAYLKQLEQYSNAIKEENVDKLSQVLMQNDFVLKEYALFQKALILAQQEKYKEAKEILNQIPEKSQVQQLATALKHFLLTK